MPLLVIGNSLARILRTVAIETQAGSSIRGSSEAPERYLRTFLELAFLLQAEASELCEMSSMG